MGKIRGRNCEECDHSYMNRCCICRIRTGVIILGLVQLVIQVASIIVMAQVLIHPDAFEKESSFISDKHYMKVNNMVTMVISLLLFTLTAMMVYGTIKRQPGYLLPFFCLQVFDLCVCVILLIGAMTNHDQIVVWKSRVSHHYRYMKLEKVDQKCLLVTFAAILIAKAYFANCVWTCYKLFVIRSRKLKEDTTMRCCSDSDFETLLPNYDDATKETPKESPPPYVVN